MKSGFRLWWIGLCLTLLGVMIGIGVGVLAMGYLRPIAGDAVAYAVVFAVAFALSVAIARVLRWFYDE